MNPTFRSSSLPGDDFEEIQFFNDKHYNKGVDWYLGRFEPPPAPDGSSGNSTDSLLGPGAGARRFIYFDKSATYFDEPKAALRASALLPDASIIILLIDPVDRAHSWYQHIKAHGDPVARRLSFEQLMMLGDTDAELASALNRNRPSGGHQVVAETGTERGKKSDAAVEGKLLPSSKTDNGSATPSDGRGEKEGEGEEGGQTERLNDGAAGSLSTSGMTTIRPTNSSSSVRNLRANRATRIDENSSISLAGDNNSNNNNNEQLLQLLSAAKALRKRCLYPGYYSPHLLKWLDYYSSRQIIIIDGDWFKYNPAAVMNRLQLLLRVDTKLDYSRLLVFDERKGFYCQRRLAKVTPGAGSPWLTSFQTRNVGRNRRVGIDKGNARASQKHTTMNDCLGPSKGRNYAPLSGKVRNYLERHYRVHNRQLARLLTNIGQPLPNWLDKSISLMQGLS